MSYEIRPLYEDLRAKGAFNNLSSVEQAKLRTAIGQAESLTAFFVTTGRLARLGYRKVAEALTGAGARPHGGEVAPR